MTVMIRAGAGALLACLLAGCATTNMGTPGDPLERMNRATHKFNDAVDRGVLKPVAKGYLKYVPEPVRNGIDNVLENLAFPTTIVNDLLQLKLKDSLVDLGRFAVNTTLGIGGIFDPASSIGMPRNDEDFGQTLGRWGVPSGPYLVLPLLGPSTMRDAPSIVADGYTDIRTQAHLNDTEQWSLGVLSIVHRRSELLPFDPSFDSAYDRYAFIRNAWLQRREYQVKDGEVSDGDFSRGARGAGRGDGAGVEGADRRRGARIAAGSAATEWRKQLRDVADAGERGDRGRHVAITQGSSRRTCRDRPFEQQRETRTVDPRDLRKVDFHVLQVTEGGVALAKEPRGIVESDIPGKPEVAGTRGRQSPGIGGTVSRRVSPRHRDFPFRAAR